MVEVDNIRQRSWDFALAVVTVVLLAGLGIQSFIGTIYVWWAQRAILGWEQSSYGDYVAFMNAVAAPMLIALVVVMGLCVPKRLFSRRVLLVVSLAMVAAGVATMFVTGSLAAGVAVYLGLAGLIQVGVVALTLGGARGPSYMTEGRLVKTGSGLLHLGFIMFGIVVAVMQDSVFMLPVFWMSAAFMTTGTVLSFYANRFSWRRHPESRHEHPIEF